MSGTHLRCDTQNCAMNLVSRGFCCQLHHQSSSLSNSHGQKDNSVSFIPSRGLGVPISQSVASHSRDPRCAPAGLFYRMETTPQRRQFCEKSLPGFFFWPWSGSGP
jgi:hypothetical protein